jgi:hypothetical protein
MNNPFKEVYDEILKISKDEYHARNCAKALYADYVRTLPGNDFSAEYILQIFEKYTTQLNEVLA